MRLSHYLMPTTKEEPSEADTRSHSLMLRAGLIRRLTAGVHTFLPLGWRVMKKIDKILREEQERFDCQEVLMPVLNPRELWEETGRWNEFGDVMFRLKDRKGRDLCLGPTHEEVITDLARAYIKSYRELPQTWYQIQTKFRDEARPRAGVVRGRQFTMMDAYSFDCTEEGLDKSYDNQRIVYERTFTRCGLEYSIVGASSGLMGGKDSQEFMLLSNDGEDTVIVCESCGYAANSEVAKSKLPVNSEIVDNPSAIEEVHTPEKKTIEAVSNFLKIRPMDLMKSVAVMASDGTPVLALIRGDLEVNETKLMLAIGSEFRPMELSEIVEMTGAEAGFIGPIGWKKKPRIIVDDSIIPGACYVTGANKNDYHIRNVVSGRDFKFDEVKDIRVVRDNEFCSVCGAKVKIKRAIEIGHIFKLGRKYTTALGAKFTDAEGAEYPIIMGCYGIGLERIMAGAIDMHADKDGISWPVSIAPFDFVIITLMQQEEKIMQEAERIYHQLRDLGRDVIWDDRDQSPGVKFKDADLIGIPIHIVIGKKFLEDKTIEVKDRKTQNRTLHKPEVILEELISLYHQKMRELTDKADKIK
jgi:prolyl-tRNA synthetase